MIIYNNTNKEYHNNNFDPPAGKLVFSAAKAAENTLFSCRRTVTNKRCTAAYK
jgi:hypothetical protein